VTIGLIPGGVLAAPLGAPSAARVPAKPLTVLVGCVVWLLSIANIISALRQFL
jgi:uncharacterized membrane protein YfcA